MRLKLSHERSKAWLKTVGSETLHDRLAWFCIETNEHMDKQRMKNDLKDTYNHVIHKVTRQPHNTRNNSNRKNMNR